MHKQGSILLGTLFILAGLFFLAAQFFPGLAALLNFTLLWPVIVLGTGVIFLFSAFVGEPGTAVPGVIVTAVGSILFYQNWSGNWGFWQLWLLMPGAVGLGILLYSLLDGKLRETIVPVGILLTISAVLFAVFSIGGQIWQLWPLALIVLGVFLLVKNLFHGRGNGNKSKSISPEKSDQIN